MGDTEGLSDSPTHVVILRLSGSKDPQIHRGHRQARTGMVSPSPRLRLRPGQPALLVTKPEGSPAVTQISDCLHSSNGNTSK